MDRTWITKGTRFTCPYMRGVSEFMKFVREHTEEGESILCPCSQCLNILRKKQEEVERHINCNGMSITYTRWVYHGEALSDDESHSGEHGLYESDEEDEIEEDNGNNYDDDASAMVDELEKSGKKGPSEPNLYAKLMEEAKRELHEGCNTYTRLAFIMRMLYVKTYSRTTNRAFNMFLELLSVALPWVDFPK